MLCSVFFCLNGYARISVVPFGNSGGVPKRGSIKLTGLVGISFVTVNLMVGLDFLIFTLSTLHFLRNKVGDFYKAPFFILAAFQGQVLSYYVILGGLLPSSASWAWRSILAGRNILKKGWRWNLGNGFSIDVWRDPWLPSVSRILSMAWPIAGTYPWLQIFSLSQMWKQFFRSQSVRKVAVTKAYGTTRVMGLSR